MYTLSGLVDVDLGDDSNVAFWIIFVNACIALLISEFDLSEVDSLIFDFIICLNEI